MIIGNSTGCCGLRLADGVDGTPDHVLKEYIKGRNECTAHTFVVMSFPEGRGYDVSGFVKIIRDNKLGTVKKTKMERNINHGGWKGKGGSELCVIILTPNHSAMTKWYQENVDKDYLLR